MAAPLWKTISQLRGLAMCCVVLNHAMQQIPAPYLLAPVPLLPAQEPAAFAALMVARGWAPVCLHAFLLVSGFVSFQFFRGPHESWAVARQTLRKYLTWAVPMFAVLALVNHKLELASVLGSLVVGGPMSAYWFLVLIATYYLVAPALVGMVRARSAAALWLALLLTVANSVEFYTSDVASHEPFWLVPIDRALRFLPFFIVGMVAAKHASTLGPWLVRHRRTSLWACALSTVAVTVESVLIARHEHWVLLPLGSMYETKRAALPVFSLSVLAVLTTVELRPPSFVKWLNSVGNQSLGILLMMDLFQYLVVATIWHIPGALWPAAAAAYAQHQPPAAIAKHALWLAPVLFAAGLWGPLLVMDYSKRVFGNGARAFF